MKWVSVDPSYTDTVYWNTNDNFQEETNEAAHNDSNYTFVFKFEQLGMAISFKPANHDRPTLVY